jgi:hypothetical protein
MELYTGHGELFLLGKTEKQGGIISINLPDFAELLTQNLNGRDIEDIQTVKLKILPKKPENVSKNNTHSVKIVEIE